MLQDWRSEGALGDRGGGVGAPRRPGRGRRAGSSGADAAHQPQQDGDAAIEKAAASRKKKVKEVAASAVERFKKETASKK